MKYLLILIIAAVITQTGCYYDKHELLYPDNTCDTSAVTFSKIVVPVLNANCTGCHSGTNTPNGVKLDTYTGAKAQAMNGMMMGVIMHAAGFSQMPKNAAQLNSCNIEKIRKWIAAGALNN